MNDLDRACAAPRPTALLATSDKGGVIEFGAGLAALGWELVATEGTRAHLSTAGLVVRDIGELAAMPTLLGGRLKTLHHRIFGGLLQRRGRVPDDDEATRFGFARVDLLACSFYPFDGAVTADAGDRLELIDVGGPAMLRAAAKNREHVIPLSLPGDYGMVLGLLERAGGDPQGVPAAVRRRLASTAFSVTARYDAAIAAWLDAPAPGDSL